MNTYIALLRGVNVGGKNKLPMKELVKIMMAEGYVSVRTYIQSGNVVFNAENASEEGLSQLIETHFGFKPSVLLLSKTALELAAKSNPFDVDEGKSVQFYFCLSQPQPDMAALENLKSPTESFALIDQVFYLHAPDGIGRSKLVEKLERFIGVPGTVRNLNTINKLLSLIE